MASLLRQIVAGPRARHPEAGLDLCYVTDDIIATSGPSQTYPQRAYRNPLDQLVAFLDSKHGKNWAIWEFRGEGTGYPDSLVYNRIRHYPWPDHHPPPFRLVPMIVASMHNWLSGNDLDADAAGASDDKKNIVNKVLETWKDKKDKNGRVVVVHCKAGKGRSGTMACSYLIAECGWTPEQAITRFTERRMRPKFGAGVSIPSQLRWVGYVDRWTKGGKRYVDREVEVVEVHVWGLRNGVKLQVEGFVDEGKKIKVFHTFTRNERHVVEGNAPGGSGAKDTMQMMAGYNRMPGQQAIEEVHDAMEPAVTDGETITPDTASTPPLATPDSNSKRSSTFMSKLSRNSSTRSKKSAQVPASESPGVVPASTSASSSSSSSSTLPKDSSGDRAANSNPEPGGMAVIFRPERPVRLPTSDVNVSLERRNRAPTSMGMTWVTAVAHVWFNAFFEGGGPEQAAPEDRGVFEIEWDKMDGIKGSSQKGTRAADRIAVVWRAVVPPEGGGAAAAGQQQQPSIMRPADWKGGNDEDPDTGRELGLRVTSPDDSANVSKASSIRGEMLREAESGASSGGGGGGGDDDEMAGVRSDVPDSRGQPEQQQQQQHDGGAIVGGQTESRKEAVQDGVGGKEKGNGEDDDRDLAAYAEKLPKPEGSGE
ncbi:phosphatases II [Xylariaceae sp. FL0804]|nr:phosphatases II [Xylariaceae sp. FL0804]